MTFTVRDASWIEDNSAISSLRKVIFVEEQGVSPEEEMDGQDNLESTIHFLGLLEDKPIATGRVLESGKIGRVCVLPEYRGAKFGMKLINEIIVQMLEKHNRPRLYLHAQTSASDFYTKCGFAQEGEVFVEAGIDHIRMHLNLTNPKTLDTIYSDRVIRLANASDFARHLCQCTSIAQRSLDIMTLDLSSKIYGRAFADSVSRFVRSNRHATVRALIQNTQSLKGTSHPLTMLAQRLPSSISLRRLKEKPQNLDEGFAIADKRHMVFFNNEAEMQGFANYRAPAEAQHQLEEFDTLWRYHSDIDPNLVQLTL